MEAETWAQKAIELARSEAGEGNVTFATSLNNLGSLYGDESRYAEAEPLDQRALAIDEKAFGPNSPGVATSLNNLAALYLAQGRYAEAEPLFRRALTIEEKVGGDQTGGIIDNLAFLYRRQGRYAEAEPLDQRALAIDEKAFGHNHPFVAMDLKNFARLYVVDGRYTDAVPLFKRALAIDESAFGPDNPNVSTDLIELARLYEYQRHYAEAEPLLDRALTIDGKALVPDNLTADLIAIGGLNEDLGRYAEAEPLFKRALAIREKALGPDHPDVATDLENLGVVYSNERRYTDAEPLFKRALAIREKALGPDHPDVANSLNNLAWLYGHEGRYADALLYTRRAVAILGARAGSRDGDVQDKSRQSEQQSHRNVFLGYIGITGHLLASGSADAPQLAEENFFALQLSKVSDTAAAVAHMAARFAAGSDALAGLVRARQDSQDRLDGIEATLLQAVSKPPVGRDPATEDRLRSQAEVLRQGLKDSDNKLAAKFPQYAELANPKPVALSETRKLLAPDEALIAFAIGENESYVAVVGHGDYKLYIAPVGSTEMSDAVKKLRKSLDPDRFAAGRVPPFEAGTAYKLYQQMLAPAEASLKGTKRLYVVTDGALESLPLSVLLTEKPKTDTLSEPEDLRAAHWLAKRYAVTVLPSISSLKVLRQYAQSSHAKLPFLGIGDPLLKDHPPAGAAAPGAQLMGLPRGVAVKAVFQGDGVNVQALRKLPSLPETANELAAEATLFNAGSNSLLLREAATVTAVKHADLADRRVIAFATHGLLAGDVGLAEPGLVMTPPANPTSQDDGLLKASEIAQLKLNADLVILSACNTASPDGTPGAEAFSGLAKAFLYAGARSLLVSHWSVVSDSTVELMTRMSAHLDQKGAGRAQALQLAMLDVMNDKTHPEFSYPVFWAPFVIVGEGW